MPIKSNLQRTEDRLSRERKAGSVKDGTRKSRANPNAKSRKFYVVGWRNSPRTAP